MFQPTAFLPDPFLCEDGTRVTLAAQWPAQAVYFRGLAQEHMYGRWPGKPQTVEVLSTQTQSVYEGKAVRESVTLRINDTFNLDAILIHSTKKDAYPVITINAGANWPLVEAVDRTVILEGGYAVASFNRGMIRPDKPLTEAERSNWPELSCGTIMAWGWGHSILADWLERRGDCQALICTGHSRGGKAALCAGIFDDRFHVVAPIGSGCGGAGSARFLGTIDGSRQDSARCESIGSITHKFPHWFGGDYASFGSKEPPYPVGDEVRAFPLDSHLLRAACAPRAVFASEGTEDYWSNLFGTQLGYQAAQPVFDLLRVPERNGFHARPGRHEFNVNDWMALVDFCDVALGRERSMRQDVLNRTVLDISLPEYAPWIVA